MLKTFDIHQGNKQYYLPPATMLNKQSVPVVIRLNIKFQYWNIDFFFAEYSKKTPEILQISPWILTRIMPYLLIVPLLLIPAGSSGTLLGKMESIFSSMRKLHSSWLTKWHCHGYWCSPVMLSWGAVAAGSQQRRKDHWAPSSYPRGAGELSAHRIRQEAKT